MITGATVTIGGVTWTVNVATSVAELTQGLSGTASLPEGTGMLFDMGSDQIITVNAYQMLYPLSVVYINSAMTVVDVSPLLAIGQTVQNTVPARFFLEVNVGDLNSISTVVGQAVTLTGYTPPTLDIAGLDMGSIVNMLVMVMIVAMMMKMMTDAMNPGKQIANADKRNLSKRKTQSGIY